jgi:hypothetical protein
MSAPRRAMRDAEEIRYGFLAAKASVALQQAMRNEQLTPDDLAVLAKASRFLSDIADGASILDGHVLEGVRPSRSIAALDVAFGPLDLLKQLVDTEKDEIAPVFRKLSQAVSAVHDGAGPAELRPTITHAQQFFDGLSGWLANEVSKRKDSATRSRNRPL